MKAVFVGVCIALTTTLVAAEKPDLPPELQEEANVESGGLVIENVRQKKVVTLSVAELAKLPHAEVEAEVKGIRRKYSGVPLSDLLPKVDVDWSGQCSPLLTCYVLVEGADGYRVLFSIPEIDPGQRHQLVILADRCEGEPLPSKDGPYQVIEEGAKHSGRFVRQVQRIALYRIGRQWPGSR